MHEDALRWGFDGAGKYAHSGMFKAALYIRQEIENHRALRHYVQSQVRMQPASYIYMLWNNILF